MIKPGRYRHFKGNEYEVIGTAKHSETLEEMVVYRALYGEFGLWVRPAKMWEETVERDGKTYIVRKRIGYTDNILVKVLKNTENYSIIENYTSLELKELGYSTEEIRNMKNISLYDEILLKPSK